MLLLFITTAAGQSSWWSYNIYAAFGNNYYNIILRGGQPRRYYILFYWSRRILVRVYNIEHGDCFFDILCVCFLFLYNINQISTTDQIFFFFKKEGDIPDIKIQQTLLDRCLHDHCRVVFAKWEIMLWVHWYTWLIY